MPCDTITQTGIELGPNIQPSLLMEALTAMKLEPRMFNDAIRFNGGSYDLRTKQATVYGSEMAGTIDQVDQFKANIKREYGVAVLKSNAKRYGWQLKQTGDYKYQIIKSTY